MVFEKLTRIIKISNRQRKHYDTLKHYNDTHTKPFCHLLFQKFFPQKVSPIYLIVFRNELYAITYSAAVSSL
ncbi:MAG: hypothetical protein C7N36_04405 [Bacteroidetes bacterium]|nr:MAG: hypothetical protein C7N36_04405 [Bacteroidota bacterium]